MSCEIVTIGSATIDQFADVSSELIKIITPTSHESLIAFPSGSKLLIQRLVLLSGGGGTNSAVGFSRLGFKTAFLGKLGGDTNGDFVLQELQREGVEFIGAREGVTGTSVILDNLEHDRTILVYKGANNTLRMDEVGAVNCNWIYISSMLGDSFHTVLEVVKRSHAQIAFNPSNYQVELGLSVIQPLIDKVDVLVMNKEEACKIIGWQPEADPPIAELMRELAKMPPRLFAITDGECGAYAYDREVLYYGGPTPNLAIEETTGAGDAFATAFTAAFALGKSAEFALRLGMANAESVLTSRGAKEKLLTRDQAFLRVAQDVRELVKTTLVFSQ